MLTLPPRLLPHAVFCSPVRPVHITAPVFLSCNKAGLQAAVEGRLEDAERLFQVYLLNVSLREERWAAQRCHVLFPRRPPGGWLAPCMRPPAEANLVLPVLRLPTRLASAPTHAGRPPERVSALQPGQRAPAAGQAGAGGAGLQPSSGAGATGGAGGCWHGCSRP